MVVDDFIPIGQYSRPGRKLDQVMALVAHWTAMPWQNADQVRAYYATEEAAQEHYGSAHYVVDLDGTVLHLIPDDEVAYHVGSAQPDPVSGRVYTDWARRYFGEYASSTSSPNHVALGVEMCVQDLHGGYTQATWDAAVQLFRNLVAETACHLLVRHYDVVGYKDCPRWMVQHPDEWARFRREIFL